MDLDSDLLSIIRTRTRNWVFELKVRGAVNHCFPDNAWHYVGHTTATTGGTDRVVSRFKSGFLDRRLRGCVPHSCMARIGGEKPTYELYKRGNKVIISGRRKSHLDSVAKANPGIEGLELDIADLDSIKAVTKKLIAEHPDLNVLINNAGIMEQDQAEGVIDDKLLVSTVTTNLLGPIRLTSALVDQLKSRRGVVIYNTSVLAFVPLAVTAVYSATKAALHSYVLSQRFLLRDSGVPVLELAPPWVRTELMNSQEPEQAIPLDRFIAEALDVLGTDANEILVETARPLRANPGLEEHALVNGFNQQMVKLFTPSNQM
jgi:uncharacterized oxidoreductase